MAKKESCLLILVKMFLMLAILVAAIVAGAFWMRDFLNEYFNRGDNIDVPDFRGKHLVEVFKEKPSDLIIEKRDEKFDPRLPKDHVIAQFPEPGTKVKRNKKVLLTISLGSKQVNAPDLIEKNSRESVLALLNAQLKEGNRAWIHSSKVPKDRIVSQNPLPFTSTEVNGGVNLLISLGPAVVRAQLPNLIGRNLGDARSTLSQLGLKEGKISFKKDANHAKDRVMMTRPGPYETVTEGTPIDLLICSGSEPGSNPDELKRFEVTLAGPQGSADDEGDEGEAGKKPSKPAETGSGETAAKPGKAAKPEKTEKPEKPVPDNKPAVEPPRIMVGDDPPTIPAGPAPGSVEEEEDEEDDVPVVSAAKPAKPAKPAPSPDEAAPAGETTTVSFVMPDGFMPKEVKFYLASPQGRREVYSGTHKPLDLIKARVPAVPGGKLQIYINNIPIEERSL